MDSKRKQKTKAVDVQGVLRQKAGTGEAQVDDPRLRCLACGQVHRPSRLLHLPNGQTVGNYSEEYRLYAEARTVLKRFRTRKTRQLHLQKVAELRGASEYHKLRDAMLEIYEREKND
jgi:hypothetical protein